MEKRINMECIKYMKDVVERTGDCFESGGILLGLRTMESLIVEKVVAIPSITECIYSYSLDGDRATEVANASDYEFVGIWHSHINSCDHFSVTDHKNNIELAKMFEGIVSILVVGSINKPFVALANYIDSKGEYQEINCNEIVLDN